MTIPEVEFLSMSGPEFIPEVGVSGYVRLDLVRDYQPIDGESSREFLFHKYSWAEALSGSFEFLREVPFGLATVSGA